MESVSGATAVMRRIEQQYKDCIDSFVQEGRISAGSPDRPAPIDGMVLARAHEQAWRNGIVRAARSTDPQEWAKLTVTHEAAAYHHLLGWTAGEYQVSEADISASQTSRGYRQSPR